MTAGKIERVVLTLQTAYHEASFKGAGDQRGQIAGIDVGTDLASPLSLLGNRLETIQPPTERPPSLRSQLRIAIVGIDGRVQQRASSRHQPSAADPKVPDDLFQAING